MGDLWLICVGLLEGDDIVAQRHGVVQVLSERSLDVVGRHFEWPWGGLHSLLLARGKGRTRGPWVVTPLGLCEDPALVVAFLMQFVNGVFIGAGVGAGVGSSLLLGV